MCEIIMLKYLMPKVLYNCLESVPFKINCNQLIGAHNRMTNRPPITLNCLGSYSYIVQHMDTMIFIAYTIYK